MNVSRAILSFVAVVVAVSGAKADLFLRQKLHTDSYTIMGATVPATDQESQVWLGKDNARIDRGPDTSIILELGSHTLYILDRKGKTYSAVALGKLEESVAEMMGAQGDSEKAQALAMMKSMASMMEISFTVTDMKETKTIGKWNSKRYKVVQKLPVGTAESEIWATEQIGANHELYNQIKNTYLARFPGFEAAVKELQKIKGFPVMMTTSSTVMGATVKSTEKLLSAEDKTAPDGTYDIPKDYTKQ